MDKLIAFHELKYIRSKQDVKEVKSRFWFDGRNEYKDEDRMYFGTLVGRGKGSEFLISPDICKVGQVIWHYPKIESKWKKT